MGTTPTISLSLLPGRKMYFASDFHLGSPDALRSAEREKEVVRWLETIRADAAALFLVGDIFDYWFEYKYVVHKGFIRLWGKLAEIADAGIPIYYFTGNHDMWMRDYLREELGAVVNRNAVRFEVQCLEQHRSMFVGHGDGLGPGDYTYKRLKRLFENPLARFAFRQVHPDLATRIAFAWSRESRAANNEKAEDYFKGEEKEWLYRYCLEMENTRHHDYYIFGHRHLPIDIKVGNDSRYINLGEWFSAQSRKPYALFDGSDLVLRYFKV